MKELVFGGPPQEIFKENPDDKHEVAYSAGQVIEEFKENIAVGFGEWMLRGRAHRMDTGHHGMLWSIDGTRRAFTTKELYKKYKEEAWRNLP